MILADLASLTTASNRCLRLGTGLAEILWEKVAGLNPLEGKLDLGFQNCGPPKLWLPRGARARGQPG